MPIDHLARAFEVLVVDDEAGIRELLVGYFRTRDFRVASAQDGRAAITTLQRAGGRFSLVVTDLNLPGADGFAVLQAARQVNPQCFVVIITGYASLDSAIRAVRVGAYDYLTKPFSLGQLDLILSRIQEPGEQRRPVVEVQPTTPGPMIARATPPTRVTPPTIDADLVIDAEIVGADAMPATRGRADRASADVGQRLGQLEAAFGRIEALLRERR